MLLEKIFQSVRNDTSNVCTMNLPYKISLNDHINTYIFVHFLHIHKNMLMLVICINKVQSIELIFSLSIEYKAYIQ